MATLRLSAQEVQALIGDALRARLKAAGFTFDRSMDARTTDYDFFAFPITLALGGLVHIVQDPETGEWTFQQTASVISERLFDSFGAHAEAMARREQPTN